MNGSLRQKWAEWGQCPFIPEVITYPLKTYKKLWKDPPCLMGKSTISMAIFNSCVKLPEDTFFLATVLWCCGAQPQCPLSYCRTLSYSFSTGSRPAASIWVCWVISLLLEQKRERGQHYQGSGKCPGHLSSNREASCSAWCRSNHSSWPAFQLHAHANNEPQVRTVFVWDRNEPITNAAYDPLGELLW